MITVTIWHNVALDGQGHQTGMLHGYQPGDPMARVFTYPAGPARRAPEEAFAICNGHPRDALGEDLARRYYARQLRSLAVGDDGWALVRGSLNEVRTSEHGTRPLPGRDDALPAAASRDLRQHRQIAPAAPCAGSRSRPACPHPLLPAPGSVPRAE